MYSAALLVLSGNVAASFLTLLRNLLVARLISVEDYGIAATFAVVMALIEMVSAFGLQQQIVQAREGNEERWQAALQGFQVMRAVISAAVLVAAAPQIAAFLGVPEVTWAYRVIAGTLVLNGLVHLDIYRLNREMTYLPGVLTFTVPALVSLLMVWPLWWLYGDYRVMLWSIMAQMLLQAVVSQLVARRRYRLLLDRAVIGRAMAFGWPLLLNNILLFLVLNGEKLVVGRELGMASLAIFAMGFTLTLTPTMVVAKSVQSFFLPQLSSVQDDDARYEPLARTTIEANLLNGCFLVLGVLILGEPFVEAVLGDKYAELGPLMTWLGILMAMRVFKAGPAVAGIARAKTENALVANTFRVLSIPLSWWAAISTGDLLLVIWIATAGEILGVIAAFVLVRLRARVDLGPLAAPLAATAGFLAIAALHAAQPSIGALAALPRWPLAVAAALAFGVCFWTMRDVRDYLRARSVLKYET
ncbi:oligosaccharide flippase family protein [Rhodobacterales bacterium HKCCE2091]|nr:oligosaccharide flippase family protein [Rhodobacterales bacterium HKCCE2091]